MDTLNYILRTLIWGELLIPNENGLNSKLLRKLNLK
jgi:hypothetical protein